MFKNSTISGIMKNCETKFEVISKCFANVNFKVVIFVFKSSRNKELPVLGSCIYVPQ